MDSALPSDPALLPSPDQVHAEANQWTLHGIDLMQRGDRDSLLEALLCFEQAIALRETLPLDENPLFRWGLTAGWMNRAYSLTRLGGPDRLLKALSCYDIAIAHLHRLPLDSHPIYRWRLCVAWMNRGITEQTRTGELAFSNALRCFNTAVQVMKGHETNPRLDYQQVQASLWMNRANAQLQLPSPEWAAAADSARRALTHSRISEDQDPIAAEAGIKARHMLCHALAHLLETPPVDAASADRWILEATDAVEDVMRLTRHDVRFQPLREELFHFGCRIYRAFQPHFLAEFLEDGLESGGPTETMRQAAHESLMQAAFQIQQENLASYTPSKLDRLIQTLRALSETGERLGFRANMP